MRISDWSSDVCPSDLHGLTPAGGGKRRAWHRAVTKEGSMTHLPLAALGLVSTLALAACTPSGIDMSTPASPSDAAARGQDGATYRTNPRPTQAYRITMTITDAPGPFASMRALAQYDVVNKQCLSPPKDNPGGHPAQVPTKDVEIPLTRVSIGRAHV